jgi:2-iminobutanoate/2-iminopropanoate deaminase
MTRQIIRTAAAPGSPLFSQGIRVGNTVYTSGIVGIDPATSQLAGTTIQSQARQAILNCESILEAAGASLDGVVDVHVLLARPEDFASFNEEYAKFFPADPPVRAVSRLGPESPNLLVSVRMMAVIGH